MSASKTINLKIWRQKRGEKKGRFETYTVKDVLDEMSFLEVLDILNENLAREGKEPVEFDSDCREGICGTCGLVIKGTAHGTHAATTTCEVRMRSFKDGETITVEPFRAGPFPIIKDLVVDRTAFDRIQQKGGYVSANVGSAPDGNAVPVPKHAADKAMDAASCIGCGACVAACPNGAATLFAAAKVEHLARLPQGRVEAGRRVCAMTVLMRREGFGHCSNPYACEAACPKGIRTRFIARLNRAFLRAAVRGGDAAP